MVTAPCLLQHDFYPRPHMEGDKRSGCWHQWQRYFYPRPHMEGDIIRDNPNQSWEFLPTPSHGGRPPALALWIAR